jgi:hypothetical protein
MTIDTARLRELAAELGFWPANPTRPTSSTTASTARTRTTGWPVIIDSITCAGKMSFGDSGRIQKHVVVELELAEVTNPQAAQVFCRIRGPGGPVRLRPSLITLHPRPVSRHPHLLVPVGWPQTGKTSAFAGASAVRLAVSRPVYGLRMGLGMTWVLARSTSGSKPSVRTVCCNQPS